MWLCKRDLSKECRGEYKNCVDCVLDKIRAEINNYGSIWVEYKILGHTDRDIERIVENVLKQAKDQVIEIIDKYKKESEG